MCMATAIALCISLSACDNTDDVTGDDWRASGDVAGSGTITHDGESDVLVSFIHENGDETELIWDPLHTIVPCVPIVPKPLFAWVFSGTMKSCVPERRGLRMPTAN